MTNTRNNALPYNPDRTLGSVFHTDELHELDLFERRLPRTGKHRQSIHERRAQPGRTRKAARKVLVYAGVTAALAGGTRGLMELVPDPQKPEPVKSQPFDYVGHGVQPNWVGKTPESEQK